MPRTPLTQPPPQPPFRGARFGRACACAAALLTLGLAAPAVTAATATAELERRIAELNRQMQRQQQELERSKRELEQTRQALDAARSASASSAKAAKQAQAEAAEYKALADDRGPAPEPKIQLGPVTVGGAMRVNYVLGSYKQYDPANGPNRGGNTGNVELDTFRINLTLDYGDVIGALEYRWYTDAAQQFPASYSFLHTGWVGYRFDDDNHIEVGVNRVPFGPGPYGVAQSYMFDMHYYLGLADDMDLGIKYVTRRGDWKLDLAYYAMSEGSYVGRSLDSTRYSFDAVRWTESVDEDGNVLYGGAHNGFDERNQFNIRAIRLFEDVPVPTELGVSLEYGQLKGERVDDGDHWAASVHMVNHWNDFKLATQLTRYEYDIDSDNPWRTDKLIPMGAFDFAWFAATKAWLPAVSLSYSHDVPEIAWLDKVVPYLEYSQVVKDESAFNDSQMVAAGAQWYRGNWLVYTDLVYANGNWFIGNEADNGGTDNYSLVNGVGDWGANGNDRWNYRFTINLGYYF
jgi:hypothetical protein